jgi:hypothetical protein
VVEIQGSKLDSCDPSKARGLDLRQLFVVEAGHGVLRAEESTNVRIMRFMGVTAAMAPDRKPITGSRLALPLQRADIGNGRVDKTEYREQQDWIV